MEQRYRLYKNTVKILSDLVESLFSRPENWGKDRYLMPIPETCGECIFYSQSKYLVHNEQGLQSECSKGYMNGLDMRDKEYIDTKFEGCKLHEENQTK